MRTLHFKLWRIRTWFIRQRTAHIDGRLNGYGRIR